MVLKHLMVGVAAIGLMMTPPLAQSQGIAEQQLAQAGQEQLAQEDIEFATDAAEGGLKEVQLGELAQQQAESEEVQQFGQRMIEDHGKANEQLKQIAQQKGIELPQELSEDAKQLYDELQQKSGREFDQAYMDEMVSDHEEDVETFQEYAETGQDPDLTSFAEETLPVLQEHLELAQQTQKQISAALDQGEQPATGTQGAQQQAVEQQEQQAQGAQQEAMETEQQATTEPQQPISLEEVLGAEVVNAAGEEVATIEDVVLDQNGNYKAILAVGGFLGIGEKKVAVPLNELRLAEDQVYLMAAATRDQLEQMPEYDEQQYRPYAEQQGLLEE